MLLFLLFFLLLHNVLIIVIDFAITDIVNIAMECVEFLKTGMRAFK